MRIAILGTGQIGGTLGRSWAAAGHQIIVGTREPDSPKLQALLAEIGPAARLASVGAAVASAEVVLLATPSDAHEELIAQVSDWRGRIVIDATNSMTGPLDPVSIAERLAERLPDAQIVKAFNTASHETYADPRYGDQAASLFLCGDDEAAKAVVGRLGETLGLAVVDVGPLANASLLESLARLWATLAFSRGYGRQITLTLLRR